MYESPCDDVYYQYSSWQAKFLIWPFSYLTTIEFCYWYIIAKAREQELSLKFGELQDVLSPGHRIHDRRSRGRRSDLVKLSIIAPGTTTRVNSCWGDSRWYDISWCYHVNKCRAIRGNQSDIAPARKSPRCHVNKPLGFTGVAFLKVPGYRFSNWASRY